MSEKQYYYLVLSKDFRQYRAWKQGFQDKPSRRVTDTRDFDEYSYRTHKVVGLPDWGMGYQNPDEIRATMRSLGVKLETKIS